MALNSLSTYVASAFEIQGFCLNSDTVQHLVKVLKDVPREDHAELLERTFDALRGQSLSSPILDKATVEAALKECCEAGSEEALTVIDAFNIPHFIYNTERKKYVQLENKSQSIHGKATSKARLFLERFHLIHQRTLRHPLFSSSINSQESFVLKPIEFLLGASTTVSHKDIIVLGMITQLKQGTFYLEDPTGAVPMDLSNAQFKSGLFTEQSFVLAEGMFEDGIFHVSTIGFPPPEKATTTLQNFGNINFFGGSGRTSAKTSEKLRQLEGRHTDAMIVFLSDVWLDQLQVLEKLRVLFAGYSEMPPTAFVLMGSFLSTHKVKGQSKALTEGLKSLSSLLLEMPRLVRESKFIFVPSLDDPGMISILPRPAIPSHLRAEFEQLIPSAMFVSNPCRLQFCTQEIVVFREDILGKMCRNAIYRPWQDTEELDLPALLVRSLVANGHLCSLPLPVCPVYWGHDQSLRLYPLPDLVVIGDRAEAYTVNNTNCIFANPGSFPRSQFSFKVYMPSSREVEDSQIADTN